MDQKELEEAVKRLYEDAPFYYTKEMLDAQAEKLIREWEKENPGPYLPINLDGFYNTVTKKSLIPTINTSLTSNESTLKEGEVAVVETKKRTWDDILTDDKIITPEIQPSITTGSVVTPEIIQTQEIAGLKDEDEIVSYGTYRYDPNKKVWVHSYEKPQVDEKGKQVVGENGELLFETVNEIVNEEDIPEGVIDEDVLNIRKEIADQTTDIAEFFTGEEDDEEWLENDIMKIVQAVKDEDKLKEQNDFADENIKLVRSVQQELKRKNKNPHLYIQPPYPTRPIGKRGYSTKYALEKSKYDQWVHKWGGRLSSGEEVKGSLKESRDNNVMYSYLKNAKKELQKDENWVPGAKGNWKLIDNLAKEMYLADNKANLFTKNIHELAEARQGVLEITMPEVQIDLYKKAETYQEQLTKDQKQNLIDLNNLQTTIVDYDKRLKNAEKEINDIDTSPKNLALKKELADLDAQIADLGPVNEYSTDLYINAYNKLNTERNAVIDKLLAEDVVNKSKRKAYNDLVDLRKTAYKAYQNAIKLDIKYNKDGEDLVAFMGELERNNHNITSIAMWVSSSALNIVGGLYVAGEALTEFIPDLLYNYYNNDVTKMSPIVKTIYSSDMVARAWNDRNKDVYFQFADDITASVQAPIHSAGDISSLSDLGAFGMHAISNYVPQLAMMYFTSGASIYLLGGSAFGNKYNEIEKSNKLGLTKHTLAQKWLSSGVAFTSEVVSERFTYGIFKARVRGLSSISYNRVKDGFSKSVLETAKNVGRQTIKSVPYMYQESMSEGFAEFGNNVGDRYVLGKQISLLEGVPTAMLTGLFMERSMAMPGLYSQLSALTTGKSYKQKMAELQASALNIEKMLAEPTLNPKLRENLEKQFLDNLAKKEKLMKDHVENVDMMSDKEKENLVKIDSEIINVRATEDAVNADEDIDDAQKETIIEDLRNQEYQLENQREDIVKEYESDETKTKKKERFDAQLKQIEKKIAAFNKRKIKDFKSTNDGTRGRVKVFETREEQQAFFNERITEYNALLQAEKAAWQEILKDPTKLNEADKAAIGLEAGKKLADRHINQINQFIKNIDTQIESNNYEVASDAGNYGGFSVNKDGGFEIFINKENALAKGGDINVAAHEFLHGVLFKSIGRDSETQTALGDAVIEYVQQNKGGFTSKFRRRMEVYQNDSAFGEEIITVMSTSIMDGSMPYNENFFTKIGDIIRQTLQRLGLRDIKFDSGRDVYNFIKDYNASIEKNYDSVAIEKMMDKGAKGKLLRKTQKGRGDGTIMASKAASDKVQRIYEDKGEAGAFDIIKEFKPIVSRIAEKRREAPNFDKELLMSEIEIGERGILDLISKYDPKSGVPLAAYINKFLPARAIEASNRVLGKEFMEDITEQVDVVAEEAKPEIKTKLKKKKIFLADRLNVKNKIDKAIKAKLSKLDINNLNFKTLKDQAPEITGELFGISPKKLVSGANITKGELQSAQMFINKNADILLTMLPEGATAGGTATGIPNTLLKAFYTKGDRAKLAKTGTKAGLAVQIKNKNIEKSDFLKVFGIVKGKPDRTDRNTSARVLALANLTGKMMTNQAVREQLMKDNSPLMTENITRISDGKNSIMFSRSNAPSKNEIPTLVFGGINALLSQEQQVLFHDNLPEFVSTYVGVNEAKMSDAQKNEILLTQDIDAVKIALRSTYGNNMSKETLESVAEEIVKTVSKLKIKPKTKNVVKQEKIVEAIIKSKEQSAKKIAKFTGSNITAARAQNDLVRQEGRRKSDAVWFDNNFQKNKEQAIADLIILGGSSFTSAKIGDGRGQFYKNSRDYYNYHLGNVGIKPIYNKNGSLNVKATAKKNGLKDIPVTRAAQSSTSAIKDHKNSESLKERRKHEKHARKVLNEYVAHNIARYKEGSQDNIDIMLMMNSLLSNMNSVLARAAKLEYIEPGLAAKDARYEHMQPRVAVLIKIVDAHINRGGIENIDTFLANYDVAIINKGFDKAITDAGYQYTLAEGQSFDDSSLMRYYNDKTLTDNRLELVVEIGTNKVPKLVESFAKANKLLKPKLKEFSILNKAINKNRIMASKPSQGITVLDFDDTLATTESLVKFTRPDGTTGTLNAEQYASTYEDLLDQGFTFDFSDFNKVVKGKLAPLFNKAIKLQGKFGPDNMFVLTARPPEAAKAIFDFLKANGLNIPLKNITGLANSTSEAKALWMADKVAEGYNDFYFADDALQNVQAVKNMLNQFDVKSKVQQAKIKFSRNPDTQFNKILEDVTGIESQKRFSDIKARKRGASKGKFRFFIPPSHEDFVGLLYNFMGKGEQGNQHRDFFEQNLIRPLNRAYREIDTAKQAIANDYKSLNKRFPNVKKKLTKKTADGDFTNQDAIRVYLWTKHGYDIPGLTKTDQAKLTELVMNDSELQAYAETLNVISKQDAYVDPGQGWEGGNIKIDLINATGRVGREKYFAEFNENAELIFSKENLNKIEAAYGPNFRSALEDMLHAIKTGVNRPKGQSGTVNKFMNYLNGSVGAVMFFNMRSAILQQMSIVNYLNFADNNILAAAKAFANQKQYWKDFAFIFNSDMLKQRRGGIGTDINGAELAEAVSKSKDPTRAAIGYLLKLGFLPTQIGDNIAIAVGGATFYRNRVNTYLKQGLSQKEAEARAFTDFQDLTQSTQQSARQDMTSQQQRSWIGKLVLNFQNITSQYNRLIKKAALDIKNRRITKPNTTQLQSDMSNMSRILYYGAVQNVVFYSLQTALFAVMFGDEEEENEQFLKKGERVVNGTIDSILRGSGIYGVAISTLKNMAIKWYEQRDKSYNKDESAVLMELLNFSPVVGIKARKIVNAEKTINYNENIISEMETFDSENPQWSATTNYIEALTNFPANRLYQKSINIRNALNNDYEAWQRALFFAGYTTWSLGLGDTKKIIEVKETVKEKKKEEKKIEKEKKEKEKIQEKIEEGEKKQAQEKKEKKQVTCLVCKLPVVKGKKYCTVHEKKEQREDGKKVRCLKIKNEGKKNEKQCGVMTSNKSGYCYYHD